MLEGSTTDKKSSNFKTGSRIYRIIEKMMGKKVNHTRDGLHAE